MIRIISRSIFSCHLDLDNEVVVVDYVLLQYKKR